MDEAIFKGNELWYKIQQGDMTAFTFSDVIWLAGIVVVVILAAKIGYRFLKVILIIVAIAFMIGFLIVKGIIPI